MIRNPAAMRMACDVSDGVDVAAAALRAAPTHQLRSLVHLASVFSACPLEGLACSDLRHVFGPKVHGGRMLHRSSLCAPLDAFHLCGSAASLVDFYSKLQAPCAAANAWLSTLAPCRRAQGLQVAAYRGGRSPCRASAHPRTLGSRR